MAAENENNVASLSDVENKGKGKAVAAEETVEKSDAMEEDEDSSDEEETAEVCSILFSNFQQGAPELT